MKASVCFMLVACFFTSTCKKDSNDNETIKDINGNVYHTVKIGTQTWMVENLKVTKYNDGKSIPMVSGIANWANLTSAGYCWYDNDSFQYGGTSGILYNWYAVNSGKLAPTGWHVASDNEWTTMTTFLGGESVAGGKLKETGTSHWQSPNTGATNEAGFNAVPGGYRNKDGTFNDMEISGNWWTATEATSTDAWFRGIGYNLSAVSRLGFNKSFGFTVRCVKD